MNKDEKEDVVAYLAAHKEFKRILYSLNRARFYGFKK